MIDGLYLSTYFDIGPLKNVLDVRLRHDHGAALWQLRDGQLILRRYWEFERLSGIKQHQRALYDVDTAKRLLSTLLAEEGAGLDDIVEIWGTPQIETSTDYQKVLDQSYAFHGVAHLMTALFSQPAGPSTGPMIAMSLDGGPDMLFEPDARMRHFYPGCILDRDGMRLFACESPGRLWSFAKTRFGLREGTLMALAEATDTQVDLPAAEFDHLAFLDGRTRTSAPQVLNAVEAYVIEAQRRNRWLVPPRDERLSEQEHRISAIMKVVAEVSARIVRRNLIRAAEKHRADLGASRFALAGGFALNCPTNSQIIREFGFRDQQIPPCASDSGIALGTGLAAFYPLLRDGTASIGLPSAYYGQSVGDIDAELAAVSSLVEETAEVPADRVAALLAEEGVIAWVNGFAEIGPRALGNRSLLADPRFMAVKDRLNRIKRRQWWRPVAPAILDDEGHRYFEDYRFSPFMALTFRARELARRTIPGVLHIDDSARLQSVSADSNPQLHGLLTEFRRHTGIPVVGNTSLNDAGEPIINRLSEAVSFAAGKGVRSLIINATTLVRLRDGRAGYQGPRPRRVEFFGPPHDLDEAKLVAVENPHQLSRKELSNYFDNPVLFRGLDIRVAHDAATVRRNTAAYIAKYPGALDRG